MPWNDQWSGAPVIASELLIIHNGVTVAHIFPTGDMLAQNITAQKDIFINGQSLSGQLANRAKGIIATGELTVVVAVTAAEIGLMEIDFVAYPDRVYKVSGRVRLNNSGNGVGAINVRYTNNGPAGTGTAASPTTASPLAWTPQFGESLLTGQLSADVVFGRIINFNGGQLNPWVIRLLLTANIPAGFVAPAQAVMSHMDVEDIGSLVELTSSGQANAGGGGTSAQLRTFQTACTDSQSFQESGPASSGSAGGPTINMYYGQDPGFAPNGNWRSYAWFNLADTSGGNGLGSLGNMNGVAASQVSYLDVFVQTDFWYYFAGGTLFIGHSSATAQHVTEPFASTTYQEVSANFTFRGQSAFISVMNTGIMNAILNGTFQAIVLAPPGGNVGYYGYAEGAGQVNKPVIRGGYYR